jgi:hypothetical protein
MPIQAYYQAALPDFLIEDPDRILGILATRHHHATEEAQRDAWRREIEILKEALTPLHEGRIFFELYIPRMGKRIDVLLISANVVFVVEFKVGALEHSSSAVDQALDYALDLKNFHDGSHHAPIVPILVSTDAKNCEDAELGFGTDLVAIPIRTNSLRLGTVIEEVIAVRKFPHIAIDEWLTAGYRPTPTIIEAAQVLYRTHNVSEISRSDAGAKNLQETTNSVTEVIDHVRVNGKKAICFVTGVPGSGKTLAGLNIATRRSEEHRDEHAVFLSGNGPLVAVLREALARDKVSRETISKKVAEREVRSFIQNIHHFRDEYVRNADVPIEKVVVFDEAQRAWTRDQAASFMRRKRGQFDFDMSEPEFLISVMDRHTSWCTVVCLVGGGQEINTGEAGISEWLSALESRFPEWQVYISPRITLPEYGTLGEIESFLSSPRVCTDENLHLAVSMRSFRAESLSDLVGNVVDGDLQSAQCSYQQIRTSYPIRLTRDLSKARAWLRSQARGTERIGLVASSGAQRLRPVGIHIKSEVDPPMWFLNDRNDVRSSFYLEEVASEFDIQGLELDWAGICWDGDFHHDHGQWKYQAFKGTKWLNIKDSSRRLYLKNAYRVLLTRARQGMILFVPNGDDADPTRSPSIYDGTYSFLRSCGIPECD